MRAAGWWRGAIALVSLILVTATAGADPFADHVARARVHRGKRQHPLAIKEYEAAFALGFKSEPAMGDPLLEASQEYLAVGDRRLALKQLRLHQQLFPRSSRAGEVRQRIDKIVATFEDEIAGSAPAEMVIASPPAPERPRERQTGLRVAALVLAGSALVGAAVAFRFEATGQDLSSRIEKLPISERAPLESERETAETNAAISWTLSATALVASITTYVIALSRESAQPAPTDTTVEPIALPEYVGLQTRWRFR